MGETQGFMKYDRELPTRRPIPVRVARLAGGLRGLPARQGAHAGRAVHGLRHPVLPHRLPAREPHPRVERPRVPRPLGGCRRAAARHQQLPGVHRPAVPGAVRGRVRARHQRAAGHDQADRGRDRRQGVGRRLRRSRSSPSGQDRQARRRRRERAGRPRRRAATHPRRARRHRLRTGRPHRRTAAVRHSRVQDGEAPPRPAPRADGSRRHASSAPTQTSARTFRVDDLQQFDAVVLAGGATAWRDLPVPGPRARRRVPGDGVPAAGATACSRATSTSRRSPRTASTW